MPRPIRRAVRLLLIALLSVTLGALPSVAMAKNVAAMSTGGVVQITGAALRSISHEGSGRSSASGRVRTSICAVVLCSRGGSLGVCPFPRWRLAADIRTLRGRADVGLRCARSSGSRGSVSVAPHVLVVSQADLRQLPLPAGQMVVEPPGGFALVGVPTNVYAVRSEPVVIPTQVLGTPVVVRARPVAWSWDFGDGGRVGPTSSPGGPYPQLVNAHSYERLGRFEITMTTYYSAEFSVNGGGYQPVQGQAQVTSPPVVVETLAGRTQLRSE